MINKSSASVSQTDVLAKPRSEARTEFQKMMDTLGDSENIDAYLPAKEADWTGTNSSLRLMNAVFRPII